MNHSTVKPVQVRLKIPSVSALVIFVDENGMAIESRPARIVAAVTIRATKSWRAASHPASTEVVPPGNNSRQRSMTATSKPSMPARRSISKIATSALIAGPA